MKPSKKPLMNKETEYPHDLPAKKKQFGQHFLRKHTTVDTMINAVNVSPETTVLEIGCGDGFLTQAILKQTPCKSLHCFEIDEEWFSFVTNKIQDKRLHLHLKNILEVDLKTALEQLQPVVVLANLPYQITFPILHLFQQNKHLIQEGVVMIQDEVAQKLIASRGRGYGPATLFFQHHFTMKAIEKIGPEAFVPPPKVNSQLLYFKPKDSLCEIKEEALFWEFLKTCFKSPRQTLKNNIKGSRYNLHKIPEALHKKRGQELSFEELLELWHLLIVD